MNYKYKLVADNILIMIGNSPVLPPGVIVISEEEYYNIFKVIQNKPEDTDTIIYKLNADTLEYVAYDRPEEPIPIETSNPYGIDDTTYNNIIDDYTLQLIEEGAIA